MKENSVLEMKNIYKSFPGVKALQAVDFTLCEGEIHALMGENGAGKSTLIKVLTGVYEKDGGDIFLKEHEGAVAIRSPQDAQNLGISTVYQEITLCQNLSVAENMYIGRGKGIVQNTYQLSDGSVVKLTVSHYYTPKGNDINGTGITPDVEVKLDASLLNRTDYTHDEDNQLQAAIEAVSR